MKINKLINSISLILLICLKFSVCAEDPSHFLWYQQAAKQWHREALPIGNGRLGAMLFGGVNKTQIQFNVDSLWTGDETYTGSNQAFGDLQIELNHHKKYSHYKRALNLQTAVHAVDFKINDIEFQREAFSSRPAQLMAFRYSASAKGAYSGKISMKDMHEGTFKHADGRLVLSGNLSKGFKKHKKDVPRNAPYNIILDYEAQVQIIHQGGTVTAVEKGFLLKNVDSFIILLAADTDFVNNRAQKWRGEHPHKRLSQQLDTAVKKGYDALLTEHINDYQQLYKRFSIDLGVTEAKLAKKSTAARKTAYDAGAQDPDLQEMLLNYARYMMIASSRPGTLPANLQGIWNNSNSPRWRGDFHTDVNLQMNYWFTDQVNLSDCFTPLVDYLDASREVHKQVTKKEFNCRGWVMRAENGIFGGSSWHWVKPSAAWMGQNLWDHYRYNQDDVYLRNKIYPMLKEMCEFWVDHLKALPDGTLVAPDGFSPEHGPHEDGVTFDLMLIWDLFGNTSEAGRILNVDKKFCSKIAAMRQKLLKPKIGKWGQLQEWMTDRDDPKENHRHISHMIGVHPGRQISPRYTPELAQAAKISMNARGNASTGWSRAWKISIWARLLEGERAYSILNDMIKAQMSANLLNFHPPFQIDGNFGYAAGVCELLVQSHLDEIDLLPCLPKAWPTGSIRGMKLRGGFTIDFQWKNGALEKATLKSVKDNECRIRVAGKVRVESDGRLIPSVVTDKGLVVFQTLAGKTYALIPFK